MIVGPLRCLMNSSRNSYYGITVTSGSKRNSISADTSNGDTVHRILLPGTGSNSSITYSTAHNSILADKG